MRPSNDEIHPSIEDGAVSDETVSIRIGEVVAHHERALVRRGQLLGPGGFQKRTIVKTLPNEYLADPSRRDQVMSAITQSAQLAHPSIAQIYDATIGADTDEFSIVSECVDGYTVTALVERAMARGIPLPGHVVFWVLHSAVDALIFARDNASHESMPCRLAHGHLHPNNILIRADGQVKVTDFGLATSLGAKAFVPQGTKTTGAFAYMAPEQIRTWQIDERSDVFALGVLLYELSLGSHPFRGKSDLAVCQAISRGLAQLPRRIFPDYPEKLERIIERSLSINPELRFQTLDGFRSALLDAFEGDANAATRASMATILSILFPEQAQTNSGKWQLPSGVSNAQSRFHGQDPHPQQLNQAAEQSEWQTWLLAFAALVILSALFWFLLFPAL